MCISLNFPQHINTSIISLLNIKYALPCLSNQQCILEHVLAFFWLVVCASKWDELIPLSHWKGQSCKVAQPLPLEILKILLKKHVTAIINVLVLALGQLHGLGGRFWASPALWTTIFLHLKPAIQYLSRQLWSLLKSMVRCLCQHLGTGPCWWWVHMFG